METTEHLRERVRELVAAQRLAVLATQAEGRPYASLVAFAATEDLEGVLFATARGTRKYRNLAACPRVALLIDSRSNRESDLRDATAVTAVGVTRECAGDQRDQWSALLLGRHPSLAAFLATPDCALFRVAVEAYTLVSHFEQVAEFRPGG